MSYHARTLLALAMAIGLALSARAQDDSGASTSAGITLSGVGAGILTGANTYLGGTIINAGTISIGAATLGGAETYTGATTISSGTLEVNGGTISSSGATLASTNYGTGTLNSSLGNAGLTLNLGTVQVGTITTSEGSSLVSSNPYNLTTIVGIVETTSTANGTGYFPLAVNMSTVAPTTTLSLESGTLEPAATPSLFIKSAAFSMVDPPQDVPEPSTLALVAMSVVGFLFLARRRALQARR